MNFQRFTGLLWASLGSLRGLWEVVGDPLGVLGGSVGVLLVSLGVPWGSSGGPRGSSERGQKGLKTQKVLSECLGRLWGALGVILVVWGGPLGPTQGAQMLRFRCFICVFTSEVFSMFFL